MIAWREKKKHFGENYLFPLLFRSSDNSKTEEHLSLLLIFSTLISAIKS